jgi:putative flippase GtrA
LAYFFIGKLFLMAKDKIIALIDFFYPPFRKFMPEQTFRYAACGGGNTVLGIVIFNVFYKYIFKEENVTAGFLVIKPHNAALFISFCVCFVVGFTLSKFVVFVNSNVKGRIQLFRYFVTYLVNLMLSYFLMKIFVEFAHLNVMASQLITTVIIIAVSYLSQKHFTFKTGKEDI